ncbi:MAG: transposase [Desulfosarcina sp.]|nr:transposase [Desulfosarcina sp.]
MARALRIEFEGAFYHVINRGNAGEDLFISRYDRKQFLTYLEKAVERYGIKVHTYCLMTNHYHLLVETPYANLSLAMQWINVSYAAYFNRKRNRRGHLFQGRFKALLVQADEYLKHLSRYIHLNPLRAKMVAEPGAYEWSSYPAFIGQVKSPAWLETDWLLGLFGKNRKAAAQKYRDFVEKAWVKETFLSKRASQKEIPQLKELKPGRSAATVVAAVAKAFRCDTEQILKKGRKNNTARDIAIYLARELTAESGVALGRYFGNISGAGVAMRYNHIAGEIENNRRLKGRINRIRKQIINN